MDRRPLFTTVASVAALLTPARDAAQTGTTDRLAVARTALHAMKLDSAALLTRRVLDSATSASRQERIQAWLLLGVVEFYQGRDSASASDFREALAIEPGLEPQGLASYDSSLVDRFDARYNLDSRLTIRFIVDTAGRVKRGSVTVVHSSMQLKQLERGFRQSLEQARYIPARTVGRGPVSVVCQIVAEFKGARLVK